MTVNAYLDIFKKIIFAIYVSITVYYACIQDVLSAKIKDFEF